MKEFYVDFETRSRIALQPDEVGEHEAWVTGVNVPRAHRRRGVGTALMRRVCDDADHEGITLFLAVVPTDRISGGPDFTALARWYGSLGFRWHGARGRELGYMCREPQPTNEG